MYLSDPPPPSSLKVTNDERGVRILIMVWIGMIVVCLVMLAGFLIFFEHEPGPYGNSTWAIQDPNNPCKRGDAVLTVDDTSFCYQILNAAAEPPELLYVVQGGVTHKPTSKDRKAFLHIFGYEAESLPEIKKTTSR